MSDTQQESADKIIDVIILNTLKRGNERQDEALEFLEQYQVDNTENQEIQDIMPLVFEYFRLSVSLDIIEQTWLDRVNELRTSRGLHEYVRSEKLSETAKDRSESLAAKGVADHRRYANSSYYDYRQITDRFADRGVVFENRNRSTHTENIARSTHNCNTDDCTQEIIR